MSTQKSIKTVDFLFIALTMSVGWGFRGNYGHEYGALLPGALVAMAICLASGREDWQRRIAYFGLFGAIGWAFGGQMSYGIVIGYTKSMDFVSVVYGFGGLFLIGFLWGGIGAAILALVTILDRKKLIEMIFPFLMIFTVWSIFSIYFQTQYGDSEPALFNYYDTDWLAAVTALIGLMLVIAIQRKISQAVSLMLHITVGWLAGLVLLVSVVDLHLSPPRSDNWAGVIGLFVGLLIFLIRYKYFVAVYLSLFVALFGGIGFSSGQLFQVLGNVTGVRIDWWKIMEQSFGFIMGLGAAIGFLKLREYSPKIEDEKPSFDWGNGFALFFLLMAMSYVNLEKNVQNFLQQGMVDKQIFGLSAHFWFALGYALLAIVVVIFYWSSQRRKLPFLPQSALGKGQLLFLLVLWWAIIGDQFQAFLKFNYGRLVVEGSFFISAVLISLWIPLRQVESVTKIGERIQPYRAKILKLTLAIILIFIAVIFIYGLIGRYSHHDSLGGSHIRFKKIQQLKTTKQAQEAIMLSEFIFDEAPFPSCHASTIEEIDGGLIAAWFGGTDEKNKDVGIWISRNMGDGWTPVVEVANGVQTEDLRYPCWNPVLFQAKEGPLMLFYKVGPNPREWWGMLTTSEDGGKTWSDPKKLPEGILGPIKNKPVQLSDGTILSGSSTESKTTGWLVYMEWSEDLGRTWQKSDSLNVR